LPLGGRRQISVRVHGGTAERGEGLRVVVDLAEQIPPQVALVRQLGQYLIVIERPQPRVDELLDVRRRRPPTAAGERNRARLSPPSAYARQDVLRPLARLRAPRFGEALPDDTLDRAARRELVERPERDVLNRPPLQNLGDQRPAGLVQADDPLRLGQRRAHVAEVGHHLRYRVARFRPGQRDLDLGHAVTLLDVVLQRRQDARALVLRQAENRVYEPVTHDHRGEIAPGRAHSARGPREALDQLGLPLCATFDDPVLAAPESVLVALLGRPVLSPHL